MSVETSRYSWRNQLRRLEEAKKRSVIVNPKITKLPREYQPMDDWATSFRTDPITNKRLKSYIAEKSGETFSTEIEFPRINAG